MSVIFIQALICWLPVYSVSISSPIFYLQHISLWNSRDEYSAEKFKGFSPI